MARSSKFPSTPALPQRHGENITKPSSPARPPPTGACNYKNLDIGDTARCGCQRYCDQVEFGKSSLGARAGNREGFCMCEHHLCFHEVGSEAGGALVGSANGNAAAMAQGLGSSPARPSPLRNPPLQNRPLDGSLPSTYQSLPKNGFGTGRRGSLDQSGSVDDTADVHAQWQKPSPCGSEVGTVVMSIESHHDDAENNHAALPPIPKECLLPSDISSGGMVGENVSFGSAGSLSKWFRTTNSSQSGSATPRHAHDQSIPDAQNMTGMAYQDRQPDPSQMLENEEVAGTMKTLTSTALAVIPTAEDEHASEHMDIDHNTVQLCQILPILPAIHKHYSDKPNLTDVLQNHSTRLEHLENASFCAVEKQEFDERAEKIESDVQSIDGRLDSLENKYTELRKTMTERPTPNHTDDGETNSQISLALTSGQRIDYHYRLEKLESQYSSLYESAMPTPANPLVMEVLLIPFGFNLRGLWYPSNDPKSQASHFSGVDMQDHQPTQFSVAKSQSLPASMHHEKPWETELEEFDPGASWYSARAFAPGSKIEQRLRSRGLVRTIEVKGATARDMQVAISTAFDDLPQILACGFRSRDSATLNMKWPFHQYHGLQASWIPLRKVHKDSRLKFLETFEMITPALWTPEFLKSVAMRSQGSKRLFVTHRQGYLQHADDNAVDWTWQKIRQLPRLVLDTDTDSSFTSQGFHSSHNHASAQVSGAEPKEPCWDFDPRLDPPPSLESSFSSHSHHSVLSIRPTPHEPLDHDSDSDSSFFPAPSPLDPGTPTSALKERPVPHPIPIPSPLSRPLHTRTTSMPSLAPLATTPSQGKRRIASFDADTHPTSMASSPTRAIPSASASIFLAKRQRTSRSPSRPHDTPRWSVGPQSPYIFDEVAYAREKAEKRGTTPFAYATPHSNAPYYWEGRAASAGSGGTDASGDGGGDIYDELLTNGEGVEVEIDVYDANSDGDADADADADAVADGDGRMQRSNESWEGVTDEDSGSNVHDSHIRDSVNNNNSSSSDSVSVSNDDGNADESDTEARALSPSFASENNEEEAGDIDSDDENQPPSEYDSTKPVARFISAPAKKPTVQVKQERRSGEWEVYVDEDADVE